MQKKFLLLNVSAFELVAVNSHDSNEIVVNGSHCVNKLS